MSVFEIKDTFLLDGKPIQIISGSIHYFRVVPEYWRDRLEKLAAMGCNAVETYIPWNFHEPRKGKFRFEGMADVEGFVRLAQQVGLYVILRPSPYICAEWEWGGLPAWLLGEDGIRLRCSDPRYLKHVFDYYDELIPRLVPLQVTHGGPVLMMQVENEYGSYSDDKAYLAALRDGMTARGVDVPLVTSDGPTHDMLTCGGVEGVFQTGNFGSHAKENFAVLDGYGISPKMCMEFWCGWFDHWGNGGHKTTPAQTCAKEFADMLDMGHVNIYMFHGGTSFGLMNGANDYDQLTPDVTSYDYDAVLTEDGRYTEKYRLFRQAVQERRTSPLPPMPDDGQPRKAYGAATLVRSADLLSAAASLPAHQSLHPISMERLGQDYGYTLYSTTLTAERELHSIRLVDAADRAKIYLDGQCILTLYDRELLDAHRFDPPIPVRQGAKLDILMENLGRVNYSFRIENQRKGIDRAVVINNHLHCGWQITCLDENALLHADGAPARKDAPAIHTLTFTVDEMADTFLELPDCGKGVVFLNGFTLGRFWDIGPQKRLYIPAPLLRMGENTLRIIETESKFAKAVLWDAPDLG